MARKIGSSDDGRPQDGPLPPLSSERADRVASPVLRLSHGIELPLSDAEALREVLLREGEHLAGIDAARLMKVLKFHDNDALVGPLLRVSGELGTFIRRELPWILQAAGHVQRRKPVRGIYYIVQPSITVGSVEPAARILAHADDVRCTNGKVDPLLVAAELQETGLQIHASDDSLWSQKLMYIKRLLHGRRKRGQGFLKRISNVDTCWEALQPDFLAVVQGMDFGGGGTFRERWNVLSGDVDLGVLRTRRAQKRIFQAMQPMLEDEHLSHLAQVAADVRGGVGTVGNDVAESTHQLMLWPQETGAEKGR